MYFRYVILLLNEMWPKGSREEEFLILSIY